jgi:hypothetical protein
MASPIWTLMAQACAPMLKPVFSPAAALNA